MKDRSVLKNGEFYLWLVLLGIWAFLLSSVSSIKHESARIWPYIVLTPFGISCFALLIMSFKKTWTDVKVFVLSKKELLSVLAMLATALLEEYLGLLPALFLLCVAINIIIQGIPSLKVLIRHILFSLLFVGICYVVFDLWLEMYLPTGIWLQ